MNAKAMLERESFIEVLTDSIQRYFEIVHKREVTVSLVKTKESKKLYIYLMPLFVSGLPVTRGMREFLYSEYNIRGNFFKYLLGKCGVFCITHSFGLAAYQALYISPPDAVDRELFISPCNRTVRFYDFGKEYVDCLTKTGYKTDFMKNQLKFRLNMPYKFVPRVIDYGDNWYRERILHGNSLARVRRKMVYEKAVREVMEDIGILAKNTIQYCDSTCYYQELKVTISGLFSQLSKDDHSITVFEKLFNWADSVIFSQKMKIPTVISHGDLQGGNIWVSNDGESIIYDWETNGRRSIWFDPATFYYNLHSGAFCVDVEWMVQQDSRIFVNDPQKDYTRKQMKVVACVILLEDIIFYLNDVLQLPSEYAEKKFREITERLKDFIAREVSR